MKTLLAFSFSLLTLLMGCSREWKIVTTTTFTPAPKQRTEVAPLIEQRVEQYLDSARVLSITGGQNGEEDIYVIAVKDGARKAKDLIEKK